MQEGGVIRNDGRRTGGEGEGREEKGGKGEEGEETREEA